MAAILSAILSILAIGLDILAIVLELLQHLKLLAAAILLTGGITFKVILVTILLQATGLRHALPVPPKRQFAVGITRHLSLVTIQQKALGLTRPFAVALTRQFLGPTLRFALALTRPFDITVTITLSLELTSRLSLPSAFAPLSMGRIKRFVLPQIKFAAGLISLFELPQHLLSASLNRKLSTGLID